MTIPSFHLGFISNVYSSYRIRWQNVAVMEPFPHTEEKKLDNIGKSKIEFGLAMVIQFMILQIS